MAILNIGRMHLQQQCPAVGIDQGMALASLDLLCRVIAAKAACFGCLGVCKLPPAQSPALTTSRTRARGGAAP
jgi:hypothetical protein